MGFFVLAAVQALKKFPVVNASIDGSDIVYHGYQDVGVAVSTERGLVVPVIRDADNLKLADVEKSILDFYFGRRLLIIKCIFYLRISYAGRYRSRLCPYSTNSLFT